MRAHSRISICVRILSHALEDGAACPMIALRAIFLLMTVPPDAGGRRRRPNGAGGDTLPLPQRAPAVPQPPPMTTAEPPRTYIPGSFNPDPYAIGVAPPPSPTFAAPYVAPSRRKRGGRVSGILTVSVLLLALGGVVYALNHQEAKGGSSFATPTVVALATRTPVATVTTLPATKVPVTTVPATEIPATAVPATAMPTVAPTITQPMIPPVSLNAYTEPDGMWSIGVPSGATITPGTLSVQGLQIDQITFGLEQMASVTVSTLPVAVTDAQAQLIFSALVAAGGVTGVNVTQQPTSIIVGDQSWQEAIITGKVNGQPIETAVYYTPHGSGSEAISTLAPAANFAADDQSEFTPMVASFRFLA